MLVDSHCHLDFPGLAEIADEVLAEMAQEGVNALLCVSVNLTDFPRMMRLVERYPNVFASVGVHPDHEVQEEPSEEVLAELATHPKVVAIGETGLDYFRLKDRPEWQRTRFRTHIRAARRCGKPLIVHTREAAEDTLRLLEEEGAGQVGGVMHCFTENQEVAERALALGLHISFSGILTFKNAEPLRRVAATIPLDRLLVETDAPYLAPVPHRGKTNRPAYVRHVAETLAEVKGVPFARLAEATSANFARLFNVELAA